MTRLIPQPAPATCQRLVVDDDDVRGVPERDLANMLLLVFMAREFEQRVLELKDVDLVHGPVHSSIGQEAVAVGVAMALQKGDMVGSTHRAHSHFLAKAVRYYAPDGYDPREQPLTPAMQQAVNKTLAEIMGLREGWCQGRGGSMHLYDGESGNLGSNAIVGGGIPLATGAAWSQKLQHRDAVVVSIFGDGAMNQGCFHEVANMAALWDMPIIYFVENNLYAVGTGVHESSCLEDLAQRSMGYGIDSMIVDGMDPVSVYLAIRDVATRIRREPCPFFIEGKTYRLYHHGGGMAGSAFGYRSKEEEAEWQRRDPAMVMPATLQRLGLLQEEQVCRLQEMAQQAIEEATGLCTERQEGKYTIPIAKWPALETALHDVRGTEDLFQGVRFAEQEDFSSFRTMTYVEAIAAATLHNMERDERVVVLGEEVANLRGGAYAATRGIKEVFPERLFNTPISECGFVGIAGGAAATGMRPIVEIMFPDFALMASDQLFNQIGKLRHMYGGRISFPLVLRTRVAMGFGYGGQHSMDPSGYFALFSGWRVMAASTPFDYVGMMNTAVRINDPVLLLDHGMLYAEKGPVPSDTLDYYIPYGKAKVVRTGTDVTVVTYLTGVGACLKAAEALSGQGISAEVIDLRTLDYYGMDYETIGQSVQRTGSLVIVEQSPRSLSLGGRISDEIQARYFDYLDGPVGRVTAPDVPLPVSRRLEAGLLPSLERIQEAIARGGQHAF